MTWQANQPLRNVKACEEEIDYTTKNKDDHTIVEVLIREVRQSKCSKR